MPWCSSNVAVLIFSHGLHPFCVSQVPANFMHILPDYSSDIHMMEWKKTLSTERLSLPGKHYTCGTICVSTTTVFHPLILPSVSQFPLTGDLHVTVRGPISKYEPKMAALSESFIHWINSNYPPTACHVVCNSSGRTKLLVTKETILKWFPQWKIFRCWCQFHYVFHEGYDDNHGKTIWVSIMNLSWEIHCYMWITQWWLWLFLS